MPSARCPPTTAAHHPPFDRLSPADFERLCLWLVRREGYPQAKHLGAAGKDRGRDLAALTKGGEVVFQCKREKQFGPAKAERAVEKILGLQTEDENANEANSPAVATGETPPTRIILLVACDVTPDTRHKAAAAADGIRCEIWPALSSTRR